MIKNVSRFTLLLGILVCGGVHSQTLDEEAELSHDFLVQPIRADISEASSWDGALALHWAVLQADAPILGALLEEKPELEARDWRGRTPLMVAASQGRLHALWMLRNQFAQVDARDKEGYTPMLRAVRSYLGVDAEENSDLQGNKENLSRVLRLLLEGGADDMAEDKYGNSVHDYISLDLFVRNWQNFRQRRDYLKRFPPGSIPANPY